MGEGEGGAGGGGGGADLPSSTCTGSSVFLNRSSCCVFDM